jgi:sortase A
VKVEFNSRSVAIGRLQEERALEHGSTVARAGYRYLSYFLLIAGGLTLSFSVVGYAQSYFFQALQLRVMRQEPAISAQPPGRGELEDTKQPGKLDESFFDSREVLGRLEIPRLKLSLTVLEGDDQKTLRLAPGHIENTAFPGDVGNAAIAGHRDTHFRALENIRKGDEISIATSEGAFKYFVQWTRVVGPDDVSVLQSSSVPELTLVTCYPFHYIGSAPKRFIVRAITSTQVR